MRSWLINGLAASSALSPRLRGKILSVLGADIGGARLMFGITISGDIRRLRIGEGSFVNTGVSLHPTGGIDIGRNVAIGPRCVVVTGTHLIGSGAKRAATPSVFSGVSIQDGCWLGTAVVVQPGVSIGAGCVIASGAVVVSDCASNGFYAGIPAKRIREL